MKGGGILGQPRVAVASQFEGLTDVAERRSDGGGLDLAASAQNT